jgi:hypothetical protein
MATLSTAPASSAATDRSPTEVALLWLEALLALGAFGGAIALVLVLGPPIAAIQVVYFAYGLLVAVLALRLRRTATVTHP